MWGKLAKLCFNYRELSLCSQKLDFRSAPVSEPELSILFPLSECRSQPWTFLDPNVATNAESELCHCCKTHSKYYISPHFSSVIEIYDAWEPGSCSWKLGMMWHNNCIGVGEWFPKIWGWLFWKATDISYVTYALFVSVFLNVVWPSLDHFLKTRSIVDWQ